MFSKLAKIRHITAPRSQDGGTNAPLILAEKLALPSLKVNGALRRNFPMAKAICKNPLEQWRTAKVQ